AAAFQRDNFTRIEVEVSRSGIKAGRPTPGLWGSGHREPRKKEIKGHPCASTGLEAPSPERATPYVLLSPPQGLLLTSQSSFATSAVATCSPLDPLAATRATLAPSAISYCKPPTKPGAAHKLLKLKEDHPRRSGGCDSVAQGVVTCRRHNVTVLTQMRMCKARVVALKRAQNTTGRELLMPSRPKIGAGFCVGES